MAASTIRRVVTANNELGVGIIALDEVVTGEVVTQGWGTETLPPDNVTDWDYGVSQPGRTQPAGCAIRFQDMPPGFVSKSMHRTTTLDYNLILDGELYLEMDSGEEVLLKADDLVVQRGTNRRWLNKSDKSCRMASVMISAMPVMIGGKELPVTL